VEEEVEEEDKETWDKGTVEIEEESVVMGGTISTFKTMTQDMTATDGPDLRSMGKDVDLHRPRHFDFGNMVKQGDDDGGLTDKETITLTASVAMLCCQGSGLEPHEIGMAVMNPGPPFAIGDMIMCNVGNHGLQWAFVRMADDPRYELLFESEITVETSRGELFMMAWFDTSPGNANDLVLDQDDPWESVRHEVELGQGMGKEKMGSYWVHGNAQSESLLLIKEAKAFVKAVKAGDVEVLEHLWNDWVKVVARVPKKARDTALVEFRWLGYNLFWKGLVRDCAAYLADTYGDSWVLKLCKSKEGSPTKLGRDQDAIGSMLWHSPHNSWFEFNPGS
jgi:hypothetical protein